MNYEKVLEIIEENNISVEELLRLITDYHGTQILSKGFLEHLEEEGYEVAI